MFTEEEFFTTEVGDQGSTERPRVAMTRRRSHPLRRQDLQPSGRGSNEPRRASDVVVPSKGLLTLRRGNTGGRHRVVAPVRKQPPEGGCLSVQRGSVFTPVDAVVRRLCPRADSATATLRKESGPRIVLTTDAYSQGVPGDEVANGGLRTENRPTGDEGRGSCMSGVRPRTTPPSRVN